MFSRLALLHFKENYVWCQWKPGTHLTHNIAQMESATTLSRNVQKLLPVVKTIALCGKQGIPLKKDPEFEDPNEGFVALLDFISGDWEREKSSKPKPKDRRHVNYTAIQNEVIGCFQDYITDSIVRDIKQAGVYSVLVDEVDGMGSERLAALSARYVDADAVVQDKLLALLKYVGGMRWYRGG